MKRLERIGYACRMPEDSSNLHGQTIAIVNTYPYDPNGSKSTRESAASWAKQNWGEAIGQAPTMEYDNKPFSLKLLKLEKRYRGGRAYKVIDSACRMFDLREDQFVDAIRAGGIAKDGQFGAPFVWAQSGQGVKLIAVGGEYHTKLVDGKKLAKKAREAKKKADPLTGSDLEAGCAYEDSSGNVVTYLGQCTCPATGKKRYAVITHGRYQWQPKLNDKIHLRSAVRTKKKVGSDYDLTVLRSNEEGRDFTAANNYTSYVKQWEGGPPHPAETRDIYENQLGHRYNTWVGRNEREWKHAVQIREDQAKARNRAFAAALIWHD